MTIRRQLVIFFSIAFGFSWLVDGWIILTHARIEFTILMTLGPTVAALNTQWLAEGNLRAFRFNVRWRRTLGASLTGALLVVGAYVVLPSLATVDAGKLNWSALASMSVYNYSTLLGGPLFEEPGWRGFALPRLEAIWSPVPASVFLGIMWAAWHLPLFCYPGWNEGPVWIYFVLLTGYSVIMTFGANMARFGVIAPVLMHAAFNSNGRLLQGLFERAQPGSGGFLCALFPGVRWGGDVTFTLIMALSGWVVAVAIAILTKGDLGYRRGQSNPVQAAAV